MEKFSSFVAIGAILLCGCSSEDATGRELSDIEEEALDTCNEWLKDKLEGRLGYIQAEEAIVMDGENSIDIGWEVQTNFGSGKSMCSTNTSGTRVIGAIVDGLEVQP